MTQDPTSPPKDVSGERDEKLKAAQQHDADVREAVYTRKLALAILSTLQNKGILSGTEIEQLLLAVKRSTDASVTPTAAVRSSFQQEEVQGDRSKVRREAKPPPVFDIQID